MFRRPTISPPNSSVSSEVPAAAGLNAATAAPVRARARFALERYPHRAGERADARVLVAAAALAVLTLTGVALATLAASHPSFLAPKTGPDYFPGWMAGPFGGLWPFSVFAEPAFRDLIASLLFLMFACFVAVLVWGGHLRARWVIAAIVIVHVAFLVGPPLQYTDVFNYINYAHMGVDYHLNPYTSVPLVEPHSDPAYELANWHGLVSPYGPLFTLGTYALVPLGVIGGFWAIKVLVCATSLAIVALVARCARLLGRDPVRAMVLVGLNPIVIVWEVGGDHNDVFMTLPIVLAMYFLVKGHRARPPSSGRRIQLRPEHLAALSCVLAVGIKESALVIVPIAWIAARDRRAFAIGFLTAGAAVAALTVAAFGPHIPGVGVQTTLVTDIGPPNLLGWLLGQGGETPLLNTALTAFAALVVVVCTVRARRPDSDRFELAGIALLVVWLTTSWFVPWYIVWVLPFAALARSPRLTRVLLVLCVYLLIAFGPLITPLLKTLHFDPRGSLIGQEQQRQISFLLR